TLPKSRALRSSRDSHANAEKVVKPPRIPAMRNVRASGERAARSSPSAPTTPIAKHPARFTRNVPSGNGPGNARWTGVAIAYRQTDPIPPPTKTRRRRDGRTGGTLTDARRVPAGGFARRVLL